MQHECDIVSYLTAVITMGGGEMRMAATTMFKIFPKQPTIPLTNLVYYVLKKVRPSTNFLFGTKFPPKPKISSQIICCARSASFLDMGGTVLKTTIQLSVFN